MLVRKGQKQVSLILTAVGLLMFIAVISTGYRIISLNSPEIAHDCLRNAQLELLNDVKTELKSQDSAQTALEKLIGDDMRFRENTLEVCDPGYSGYVFTSWRNMSYVVCGDGKIYRYSDSCGRSEKWSSLVSRVSQKKSAGSPAAKTA